MVYLWQAFFQQMYLRYILFNDEHDLNSSLDYNYISS